MSPAFYRLWTANIFTNLADGLGKTAFPLLAISLTRDPVLISIISALVMLPWLLFAVPIGTIIDNVNKKNALAFANAMRALLAASLSLMIATHSITIYWLLLITFLVGICEVIADTASQSLIPTIVNTEDFEKANSRFEMAFTVIQDFVGVPLGGLLYGIAIVIPFVANSAGFAFAAVICFLIPLPYIKKERVHEISRFNSFKVDLRTGMSFLFNHKELKRLVLGTTALAFSFSMSMATMVLFLVDDLGLEPRHFGLFMSASGVAALLGAWRAPKSAEKFGRGFTLVSAIAVTTIATFLIGLAPNIWYCLVLGLFSSFAMTHWNILLMATYQRLIPQDLYARVHGARRTLVWGCMPIASLIGGAIAKINLRLPFLIGGSLAFASVLYNARFMRRVSDEASQSSSTLK